MFRSSLTELKSQCQIFLLILIKFHPNILSYFIFFKLSYAVAQLVEALHYKSEGCGLDSRWGQLDLWLTYSFRPHYGLGVESVCSRNEYQGYLLGVKAACGRADSLVTFVCRSSLGVQRAWPVYLSSADFSGLFRLNGESRKTFDIAYKQSRLSNVDLGGCRPPPPGWSCG